MLVPFLLLSAIADPVMPQRSASGALVLVLCTSEGLQQVAFDPVTGEPVTSDPSAATGICNWACAHPDITLTAPPDLPLPDRGAFRLCPSPPPVALTVAHATGLPPATGPPLAFRVSETSETL